MQIELLFLLTSCTKQKNGMKKTHSKELTSTAKEKITKNNIKEENPHLSTVTKAVQKFPP